MWRSECKAEDATLEKEIWGESECTISYQSYCQLEGGIYISIYSSPQAPFSLHLSLTGPLSDNIKSGRQPRQFHYVFRWRWQASVRSVDEIFLLLCKWSLEKPQQGGTTVECLAIRWRKWIFWHLEKFLGTVWMLDYNFVCNWKIASVEF